MLERSHRFEAARERLRVGFWGNTGRDLCTAGSIGILGWVSHGF